MATAKQLVKSAVYRATHALGVSRSEDALARESARYWADPKNRAFNGNSHWREGGPYSDETWQQLGREHVELLNAMARMAGVEMPAKRVIEWGCGGGANAIHFAPPADRFVGVDVSQASLDECDRVLRDFNCADHFEPVLAEVEDPEATAASIDGEFDLFLCLYVVEILPGPDYVRRLLRIARQLLRPGGAAFVQMKYATNDWRTQGRRWGYKWNLAETTVMRIEDFWNLTAEAGLEPQAVKLVPVQPLVNDTRYAYFLLTRPA